LTRRAIDPWVGRAEPAESAHKPFGPEIRRRRDGQDARCLALKQTVGADGDAIQRIADDGEILLAGVRDHEAFSIPSEQLDAERRLQRLYVLADSRLADTQCFRSACEVPASRRRLESPERIQWR
jgi:hypothetical protein